MTESEWLTSADPAEMLRAVGPTEGDHPDRSFYGQAPVRASDRKLRLFAVALSRLIGPDLGVSDSSVTLAEVQSLAERVADGEADLPADTNYYVLRPDPAEGCRLLLTHPGAHPGAVEAALLRDIVGNPFRPVRCSVTGNPLGTDTVQVRGDGSLSGCDSAWLTPTVLSLATAAYEERGRVCGTCKGRGQMYYGGGGDAEDDPACFACHGTGRVEDGTLDPFRLAILADALEEVGCAPVKCPRSYGEGDGSSVPTWFIRERHYDCETCKKTGFVPHPILTHLRSPDPHVRGCWAVDLIRPWSLLRKVT